MDKDWMDLPRFSKEYMDGVSFFLDFAFSTKGKPQGDEICCPCAKCGNGRWEKRDIIKSRLICYGFVQGYKQWVNHGEGVTSMDLDGDIDGYIDGNGDEDSYDDIDGLLNDRFREFAEAEGVYEGPNEDAKKFFNLVEEAKQELYPGCKNFSLLSFTIRLYLLKCLHGWSNASFTALLDLLKEAMPHINIPSSFNKTKAMIKDLGLDYKKIDAYPNDCMLYWEEYENEISCHKCGASRWNQQPKLDGELEHSKKDHKVAAKTLRHFPLIPRLQRLFMCSKTTETVRWHKEGRVKDGKLRDPGDAQSWKDFDTKHPDFAIDPRNIRLRLASDGFNPFCTMSISYSTWPVLLMVYNLPSWLCMKAEYCMLSLLIPGPRSPGNEIDVYLQPLIKELKELWGSGVETYDASNNQTFTLRAALLWTISDFPAYAMLSSWSTKGKLACPSCNYGTSSAYLKHSRKMCYMCHRSFLPIDHPWRFDTRSFNGLTELKSPPSLLEGTKFFAELRNFENVFGKNQKKHNDGPWKKRSIFFELNYWQYNTLRHNLDVMHIEKNICDNIIGTLLDIPGKTKDHANAHFDLKDLGIRKNLQPRQTKDGRKATFAEACFSMTTEEKTIFCETLKTTKLPDGSALNISRCVQVSERKITGYKTHDAHFMLHYLLQIPIKSLLPNHVAIPLIRLGSFFRSICQKVITIFCETLKTTKLPDGSALNISRCVQVSERKITGYKTHDAHFMLHYLLQIPIKSLLPNHVAIPLIRLGSFFRSICQKVITIGDLDRMEEEIAETLCQLERIFPPCFFDVMVHLPIHLANEVRLGGPVQFRWMYPPERYMCRLKSYVRNKSHPQGSIAEAYLVEECLTFCSRYLQDGVQTRLNKMSRNNDESIASAIQTSNIFPNRGQPIGGKKKGQTFSLDVKSRTQAHKYILINCDEVNKYIREHECETSSHLEGTKWSKAKGQGDEFMNWFETRAMRSDVPNWIRELSRGPNTIARRFSGYLINGYRFHTRHHDARRKTQNSGVTLVALTQRFASLKDEHPITKNVAYYGRINDIIELDYYAHFKVVLFKCDWFEVGEDNYGLTYVHFNKECSRDEPFVLASQVHQCFYVQDPVDENKQIVMKTIPRDLFVVDDQQDFDFQEIYGSEPFDSLMNFVRSNDEAEIELVRKDLPATIIDMAPAMLHSTEDEVESRDEYDSTI